MSFGWNADTDTSGPYGWQSRVTARRARIFLDDVEFATEFVSPPKSGTVAVATDLSGWWEPADVATETVAAPSGDGVLALSDRLGPRGIVLSLMLWAGGSSFWELDQWVERLSRLRRPTLRVWEREAGVDREATTRLLGVQTARHTPNHVDVTLTLQADDPLRYGAGSLVLKSGRNVLLNPGDAVAYPTIELKGPTSGFKISHEFGEFTYSNLTGSQTRIIDCRNGEVFVKASGARQWGWSGVFPRVGVGGAEWAVSGLGSGATLTARRFQAWT